MEQYVHHIPGRLRIKIPAIRTEPGKCSDVKELLETMCDVHTVSTNPITGSVVVEYDEQGESGDQILDILTRHGYFEAAKAVTHDQYFQFAATKAGKRVSKVLFSWVVGRALNGTPLSVLTALI